MNLRPEDPLAAAAIAAIRGGDVPGLEELLRANPGLANANTDGVRTLLHTATDWPGHFPNGAAVVKTLIAHGADVNAPATGKHAETPLHWAASSDDVEVLDALLDGGANIEAPGAVIGGGTALADAVVFGQWNAARRLVERGAQTALWQAAALGLTDRVKEFFSAENRPSGRDVSNAFWNACRGGRPVTARYLLIEGADLNWVGHDGLTPLDTAVRSGAEDVVLWLRSLGAKSGKG